MTGNHHTTEGQDENRAGVSRRSMLAAVGAGGSFALAGCTNPADTGGPGDGEGDAVDPRFGYTATSADADLPVEPDHTVELRFKPRENVPIPEFFFEPTGLAVDPGDTVQFKFATPHHNVNAYHPGFGYNQRVPDGVPPFSSPVLTAGSSWLYTFEKEGVHDIMCAPHEVFGMVGRVVVGSASGPGSNPVGEAPGTEQSRPPEFTAALVLGDPAMAPDAVASAGTVHWSDLKQENKRPMLVPAEGAGGE
ncbi:MAG: plastocyanin/azurin family copper-binding protein [Halobacteriaceae archaeon]